ncbi:MAG TPA: type II toxin-antitoxin system PemK/MazF family toxin, partial [Pirellulales bacterium]|nr:type II toxin-antitoxin system PemK/MazF family toxin [Pirellulales bacterium]
AMITGYLRLVGREPTQFLIDPATSQGATAGVSYASAVKCENLATVPQTDIVETVGRLSGELEQQLDDCLRAALDLD